MQLHSLSVEETLQLLHSRACTTEELVHHYLERIEAYNSSLHAFLTLNDRAVEQAKQIDEMPTELQSTLPLAGIPIAVKDLIDTEGITTTYGGVHFKDHVPTRDAEVVARLVAKGAIVIGKTSLHEYAFGTTNENPHYGDVINPWKKAKIAGGSSGGSAVALVAGLASLALGTDTGGSVRIPASLTGVVGLKPTYGLIDTTGVFPLAASLDHVGPMARSVKDVRHLFDAMLSDAERDLLAASGQSAGVGRAVFRIGIPKRFFFDRCHASVLQVMQAAVRNLESQPWAQLEEVDLPSLENVPDAQSCILSSEALYVHRGGLEKAPELYGEDVRQRLMDAAKFTGSDYVAAKEVQKQFTSEIEQTIAKYDVLLTPTTPIAATDIGQTKAHIRAHEVQVRSHLTRYTNPWNLSGLPAISLPIGLTAEGLPVGMQLIAGRYMDYRLLTVADRISQAVVHEPLAPDFRL